MASEVETSKIKRKYGFKRDLVHFQDYKFMEHKSEECDKLGVLPPKMSLRSKCPVVYDQGELGSCTANGIAALIEFDLMKQKCDVFMPSRLFIYYNERSMEGTLGSDSGASIRDGIISVNKIGVCDEETTWPYDITKFAVKPPVEAYNDAKLTKSVKYMSVNLNVHDIKTVLNLGYLITFGISVFSSFESEETATTGFVTFPTGSDSFLGGHCIVCVGYDDELTHNGVKGFLEMRNSWGTSWGLEGYFWLPYSYLSLASDAWTIETLNVIKQ